MTPPLMLRLATIALSVAISSWQAAGAADRVAVLVDESVHAVIETRLTEYAAHVARRFPVTFTIWAEPWYERTPADIRARLACAHKDDASLVGAIMVGPIPCPLHERGPELITPAPLYYEDFDATWTDADRDGDFEGFATDRLANATEIWTAWWVPPSNDPAEQAVMLARFLDKLNRRYAAPPAARHAMLFGAGKVNSLRIGQAWAALIEDCTASTKQRVRVYMQALPGCMSVHCRDGNEFTTAELLHNLAGRRWQHLHLLTRGEPDRLYWPAGRLTGEVAELDDFDNSGAALITCSASSGANFRGVPFGAPRYDQSVASRYLFSPRTLTVAFFGSATPQAGGAFAQYHANLLRALDPENGSYLAAGYRAMRNTDHTWGAERYIFRGLDEKVLLGDPFFRYRPVETGR